jgi:transmembrane sensor
MSENRRLGPPPVEPMTDVAWSRVERGLWARVDAGAADPAPSTGGPPRGSWRWWLVAAPLAAAALIAVVVGLRVILPGSSVDEPVRVVSPRAPSEGPAPAPSSVSFDDSHILLEPDTALVTSHESGHSQVLLERGAAWFTVAPRGTRPEFVVRAGDAVVRVVGTRFRVARSEERIAVEVERGVVDVQFQGRAVAVVAGRRWSSESPAQASTLAAPPPPAAPAQPSEPAIEPPTRSSPTPDRAPGEPKRTPHPSKPAVAPSAPSAEPTHAPAAAIDVERAEYDRLAALEPHAPETALRGYMDLANGNSRWAALALYAAARLATDRHDPRADALLGMYLERFPDGRNAEDARRLLARVRAGHRSGTP